jgi:hypothetical protein
MMTKNDAAADDDPGMVTVEWHVSNGLVGCKVSGTLDVEADLTDDQIDQSVRDHIDQHVIEWGWKKRQAPAAPAGLTRITEN